MKKIFALLLTLAMVLALAACGSQPANNPAPAPSDGGQADAPAPAPTSENTKLVVGFAQIGQESGWRDAETNDVQWYAARNTDTVELHFADAQQMQENQIKAIRSFIVKVSPRLKNRIWFRGSPGSTSRRSSARVKLGLFCKITASKKSTRRLRTITSNLETCCIPKISGR